MQCAGAALCSAQCDFSLPHSRLPHPHLTPSHLTLHPSVPPRLPAPPCHCSDKERGVVWEESIILAPKSARFAFLSATVPNAREFADWVAKTHGSPCDVVYTGGWVRRGACA